MIKIENIEVMGWEPAIRGMRNPMNSWDKSDSEWERNVFDDYEYEVGSADLDLMMRLAKGGSTHAKYRRMIIVYMDITAPLYWWKEFDTYKVGTVANSCSTMHKIHAKEFEDEDFSHDHLDDKYALPVLETIVKMLNEYRKMFLETHHKHYWWQMIQLLPSSYNQKRTVLLNYEVLSHIYHDRKEHKLDEWREFCKMIKSLPYAQIITLEDTNEEHN